MEKVRPEVAGLTERVFVIRQQYLGSVDPGALSADDELPGGIRFWRDFR